MKKLDLLIEAYAKSQLGDAPYDENDILNPYEAAKNYLKLQIIEEIRLEYEDEITKKVTRDLETEQEKFRINQTKILLIESVCLAVLVGLIVNQATDLITFFKQGTAQLGSPLFISTILILAGLAAVLHIFVTIQYFHRVNELLNKRYSGSSS